MARFRRHRGRRARVVRRGRGRRAGGKLLGGGLISNVGTGVTYGYLRNKVTNALRPLTSKIPTKYADEIGVGIGSIMLKRFMPRFSAVADKILTIEAYRVGEQLATGVASGSPGIVRISSW